MLKQKGCKDSLRKELRSISKLTELDLKNTSKFPAGTWKDLRH